MKKALMVWGGWDGHQPKETVARFAPFLKEQGFEVRVEDKLDVYCDTTYMQSLSLIVQCWTMGQISNDQEKGLLDAVKSGVGLAGWHGGLCDSFRSNTAYQWMTGGQWVAHPGGVIKYRVNITDHQNPITRGLSDFDLESEQYYMHTDPSNQVLATTTFSGEHEGATWIKGTVMPAVWLRPWGKGRVFYSALGHVDKDFETYPVAEIVRRGMLWAAR
jgi:type 1 glutamine amidotransferase